MDEAMMQALSEVVHACCVNCRKSVQLCFDERMRKKWTCYGCGRMHSGKTFDDSIKRGGS